jgi:hypothetical protein
LQVDFVSAGSAGIITGVAFTGVHQSVPLGTAATEGSVGFLTSATVDLPSSVDELVFDCHTTQSAAAVSYGAGQTSQNTNTALLNFSASTKAGAGTSVTMTRAWNGSAERSVLIGASVNPAAADAATILRRPSIRLD